MPLTFTRLPEADDIWGGRTRVHVWDIDLDTSYPTGGYALTANNVGLSQITGMLFLGGDADVGGYVPHFNSVTVKLMMFRQSPSGTISAPTTTISTDTVTGTTFDIRFTATGVLVGSRGQTGVTGVQAPTFTGTANTLAQVANATDLSALKIRVAFIGP